MLGRILRIKKEEGGFIEVEATEVEEAGKTREGLLLSLGAKKKATGLLSVPISTCKIEIKEGYPK